MKTKTEIVQGWLDELRSGTPQTTYYLNLTKTVHSGATAVSPGRCCLGVLCDTMEVPKMVNSEGYYTYSFTNDFSTSQIPQATLFEWGFTGGESRFIRDLVTKNDNGWTFEQIADEIEAYFTQNGVLT